MSKFIDYAIGHARLTVATLIFLLSAGLLAYVTIPKEAEPDVKIPIIYVQLSQRGISPEDSERLLLRPVETQLKSVGNVKEMRSTAFEGGGFVLLEFEAGFDSKSALADVRAKVDQAKHDLPRDVDEPSVQEVNLSAYPVLVVGLAGDMPERTLLRIARSAKNAIEQVPGVLQAELRGARDEAVEVIVEPTLAEHECRVVRQMLADLQHSLFTGVLLVSIVSLFALGLGASVFIGIAIPASFLAGVLGLQLAGLTVNIVVLFSLILAVGMLVDDAIIVSEFAERRMAEGMQPREAYSLAAKRMAGPVIAATATRVAAFSPLLFWPGVVGQFMKYLPITLMVTLSASLAVALFFTPTLGALLGKAAPVPHDDRVRDSGPYMRAVRLALRHPGSP